MSREKLDKDTARRVEQDLPNVVDVRTATLNLQPDVISMGFPEGSNVPQAAVCLQDATSTVMETRYALFEASAHLVWYREKSDPPNEKLAVFFAKFYADDTALRMYSVGEHVANAIVNMLGIESKVSIFKKLVSNPSISSQQAIVGMYLTENEPTHPITAAILALKESDERNRTRKYRNQWVHQKPPIIEGMGIEYERRNRLIVDEGSIGVSIGGGDPPHYSVEELIAFMTPALVSLTKTVTEVVAYYIDFLGKNQKTMW
jgi:hypothetical protein